MKKVRIFPDESRSGAPLLAARTGSHCPANGFWLPEGSSGQPIFVFEGSVMPASETGAAVWHLQTSAETGRAAP
ncbi:hypothetical protein DM794_01000 [Paenarthrobacter ureafaciens]|nr:hypothetical protein [Paenarthrobacter ureafaciens]BCW86184.1 hypothetical protein NicSoilE8_38570 [Arthrobacter sp. NicSoilE8]QMU84255.1 hypothetical protein FV140_20915 [Paenarthrobacter ureafaciens]GLU65777.1 hypothetical protein Pure02_40270 [Paenarthrobacter ureafaciens]GLU70089.1 hypothetical protein Pure03_40650 [Paenarthrobacter ureafaciens]